MMPLYILIPLIPAAYLFIAGFTWSRHYNRTKPGNNNDNLHNLDYCYSGRWCVHATTSLWLGIFWMFALPVVLGFASGKTDKVTRTQRKRATEIEEANHKLELARIARREDEELDMQLAAQRRQKQEIHR